MTQEMLYGKADCVIAPCEEAEVIVYEFRDGAFCPTETKIVAKNFLNDAIESGKRIAAWRCPEQAKNGDEMTMVECQKHDTYWSIIAAEC